MTSEEDFLQELVLVFYLVCLVLAERLGLH